MGAHYYKYDNLFVTNYINSVRVNFKKYQYYNIIEYPVWFKLLQLIYFEKWKSHVNKNQTH